MKIAVIGGGSTYTPELVSGLSRERERIDVSELVLHDIDPERREVVGGLAQRMLDRQGYARRGSTITDDLDRAVDGADFVLIQIRVGGQDARLLGRDRAARLRLHRAGDDRRRRSRQGACAPFRSCSRSPTACESVLPDGAWIVDFTNPVGIVTRSLLDHGHQGGRPLQRRDRLPAPLRADARRRAEPRVRSTRSGSIT